MGGVRYGWLILDSLRFKNSPSASEGWKQCEDPVARRTKGASWQSSCARIGWLRPCRRRQDGKKWLGHGMRSLTALEKIGPEPDGTLSVRKHRFQWKTVMWGICRVYVGYITIKNRGKSEDFGFWDGSQRSTRRWCASSQARACRPGLSQKRAGLVFLSSAKHVGFPPSFCFAWKKVGL